MSAAGATTTTMADVWPPDWRTARADALEATVIRLGLILVELDELEALQEGDLGSNPEIVTRTRELAAYVRARRNGMREEMDRLRAAIRELE